jgi:heat shock protein HslJ
LAIAACVALVAALSIALALHTARRSQPAPAAGPLIGATWQGAEPALTVVFTDHTVRIFDGCTNELREVTIGVGVLDVGELIGPASTCTGTAGGPPPDVASFDDVAFSHHLSWQLSGDVLLLGNDGGKIVSLHRAGAALTVTGQAWVLERFTDRAGSSHEGDPGAARLFVNDGTVQAGDLCNDLSGSATVGDSTIAFAGVQSTGRVCADRADAAVADVVDQVLSGTVGYVIRGDELILDGGANGLLIYTPSS